MSKKDLISLGLSLLFFAFILFAFRNVYWSTMIGTPTRHLDSNSGVMCYTYGPSISCVKIIP